MKSESEHQWMANYLKNETNENFKYNEKIDEDEYECSSKDFVDEDLVKNLS